MFFIEWKRICNGILLFSFPTIRPWTLMVMPETRRSHNAWYLRFYYYQGVNASTPPSVTSAQQSVLRHWHNLFDIFIIEIYSS